MAEQRPLVIIDGDVQQLPVGDTLLGANSGYSSLTALASRLSTDTSQYTNVTKTQKAMTNITRRTY
jgi:hypothetical protein